jgi:hypothetical protein
MATLAITATVIRKALRNPNLQVWARGSGSITSTPRRIQDVRREKGGSVWVQESEGLEGWFVPTEVITFSKDA